MRNFVLFLLLLACPVLGQTVSLNAGYNGLSFQTLTLTSVNTTALGAFFWDGTAYQSRNLTPADLNAAGTVRGFWVFAATAGSLSYTGNNDSGNRTATLTTGWNLVGFPSSTDVPASTLVARRNGTVVPLGTVILPQFQEIGTDGRYTPVDVQAAGAVLRAGRAYWAFASEPVTLTYGTVAPPPATGQLYVSSGRSIRRYFNALTAANGTLTPAATMDFSVAIQQNTVEGLSLDITNNRLYAGTGNSVIPAVLVVDNVTAQNGAVTPNRKITSPSFSAPSRVTVDVGRDKLYVCDAVLGRIFIFDNASLINSDQPADRALAVPGARDLLLDVANNRLFVTTGSSVEVYNNISTTNSSLPARTLAGNLTRLTNPGAMSFDEANDLIVVDGPIGDLLVFAGKDTVTGNVAPQAVLTQNARSVGLQLAFHAGVLFVPAFTQGTLATYNGVGNLTGTVAGLVNRFYTLAEAATIGVALDPTR